MDIIIGFSFSLAIAFAAYKKRSLSKSGFLAAVVLGTLIYIWGGLWFSAIMVGFFVSSTILTKFKKAVKKKADNLNEKGGNRDSMQVIANGGIGLVFALLFYIFKHPAFLVAYGASFAEANSDTWASEIGVLSKRRPHSILTGKPVENGISGGISPLGTISAMLGSLFITLIFAAGYILIYSFDNRVLLYTVLVFLAGFIGSLIDSLLGASFQAQYYCYELQINTEKRYYNSKENKLIKGLPFFNNDIVNLSSNALASILAALITFCVLRTLP
jgi:uncharacterized protein (TIGR00297 family)